MQNKIVILMSCISKIESDGVYKPHRHPYYQLNHIFKGTFEYIIDGESYTAHPGDTILIPSNSLHSFSLLCKEDGFYYEVKFSTFSSADKELCDDTNVFTRNDKFAGVLLPAICEEQENTTPQSNEIMLSYLYSLLYKLGFDSRKQKNTPSKYIEVTSYSKPVRDAIQFLGENYMRQLTLDDIVENTDVKKSSLCKRFKNETSLSIFECLMIIRVCKAVELLTFTNMSLAQISQETAFVNLTHFNRVFSRHVMIPPGRYRKHLTLQREYKSDAGFAPNNNPIADAVLSGKKIDFAEVFTEGVDKAESF